MIPINNLKIHIKKGKCFLCNNTSLILRKHSGQLLCKECFQQSIEKIISKTISKYKMLKPQDKIIVALSGGKDSMTLLYNLLKIQENTYGSEPLIALTINEGIKNYREYSIEQAKKFCKKHNIEHRIISFKDRFGLTLDEIIRIKKEMQDYKYACNYCAIIRRRLLNDCAKELGGDLLAMGHNLTDLAETFLMNVLYKRLYLIGSQFILKDYNQKINQHYIKKILPLMRIPEEEVYLYANLKNLEYYTSNCPFREIDPIIRKRVLDFIQLCKTYSPEIEFNLLNGFLELSEILYNHYKQDNHYYCRECGYPSGKASFCTYCNLKKELSF